MKYKLLLICAFMSIFFFVKFSLSAHGTVLEVNYDECGDDLEKSWYLLSDCDSDEFRHYYSHVSDNTIIRYHIHDTGYENNSYSWTTDINEIDAAIAKIRERKFIIM